MRPKPSPPTWRIWRALPLPTTQAAKEPRIRRFLDHPRITRARHYHPSARTAVAGITHQRVDLVLDRVLLHERHNLLVASIGFRRRSVPLAWQALDHDGSSALTAHQAVLTEALAELPPTAKVTVYADREFRSTALFDWLRAQDHDVLRGIRGRT